MLRRCYGDVLESKEPSNHLKESLSHICMVVKLVYFTHFPREMRVQI